MRSSRRQHSIPLSASPVTSRAWKTFSCAIMRAMGSLQRRRAMLFRNIYLKSLRDYRIAILGWGLGIGLLIYVVLSSFPSLVETPEARASLVSLGPSFSWIAETIKIDNL